MSLWYSEGRRFEFFLTHHFLDGVEIKNDFSFLIPNIPTNTNGICFYSNILLIGFYVANQMKIWFVEHRNLKNIFLTSNHDCRDNSIKDSKKQLMLKNSFKLFFMREDFLFKHKIKSNKGCLVDALAIRGDEGRERLR